MAPPPIASSPIDRENGSRLAGSAAEAEPRLPARARPWKALTRVEREGAWPRAESRWQPGPTPDVLRHGAGRSDWPVWRGASGGAEGSGGLAGSGSFRLTGI